MPCILRPARIAFACVRGGEYGATVRVAGRLERTRLGRPFLYVVLRARVSSWPPLRLARLRFERGSVGVVHPPGFHRDQPRSEVAGGA
jgi:hypothetical protein